MLKWIEKIKAENLVVGVARANNQKHLDELKLQQQEYKLKLCEDIRRDSLRGYTYITTYNSDGFSGFITREYLENDLKIYFESKGFATKFVDYGNGEGYLKISWGEE